MARPLRVAIVDDHRLLAQSLAMALQVRGVEAIVPEPVNREHLLAELAEASPELILLDLDLGPLIGEGESLVEELLDLGASVLAVSATTDQMRFAAAVEAGAIGVMSKSSPFDEMMATVLAAARGDRVLAERSREAMLTDLRTRRRQQQAELEPLQRLTAREQAVLRLLADGEVVSRIAVAEVVAETTVRSHVRSILHKLGVSSQLEAVAMARRSGWLDARPDS